MGVMKKIAPKKRQGKLTTNDVVMEQHEYMTINVLLAYGEDVELLAKSRTPHNKSPDIAMRGRTWEIKSPTGKTLRSVNRILHRATQQSVNVILDLRRTKIADEALLGFIDKLFRELRSMRNLWIVTKQAKIIKMKK